MSGQLTLAHFFGSQWLTFHSFVAWMAVLANLCNALPVSIAILVVVSFSALPGIQLALR